MATSDSISSVLWSLDTIAKGAVFLQGIPEIQNDYDELRKQITFMRDMIRDAQGFIGEGLLGMEQVTTATGHLEEICDDLVAIEQACTVNSGDNGTKAKKAKWIIKSHKIEKLLQKAQGARSNLSHALLWQQLQKSNLPQSLLLQQFEQQRTIATQISQLHEFMIASKQTTAIYPTIDSSAITSTKYEIMQDIPNNQIVKQHEINGNRPRALVERPKCPTNCKCRCHAVPWAFQYPSWISPMLGSFILNYRSSCEQVDSRWDWKCVCGKEGHLLLKYQLPKWLQRKNPFSQTVYSLRCALRPMRALNPNDVIIDQIKEPVEPFRNVLSRREFLFPSDELHGMKLIELAILYESYEVIEVLLEIWGSILTKEGLPRRVLYQIGSTRRISNLSERATWLLGRVESYVDDTPAWDTSLLQEAIFEEGDVKELLQRQPWLIDEPDSRGYAPIHSVCDLGKADIAQHLINLGVNIDHKNYLGHTALMLAAERGHIDCMGQLLRARCCVHQQNNVGHTALHWAVHSGQLNAARLLVNEGASVSIRNVWGRTIMHEVADLKDNKIAHEMLQLLLDKTNLDLEQPDSYGNTPIMVSAQQQNSVALSAFFKAGASLTSINNYSCNILHPLARYCDFNCLRFLHGLSLSGIDTEMRDCDGWTPWDTFVYCIYPPDQCTGIWSRPSLDAIVAFVQLYQGIRDRNLHYETSVLQQSLEALTENQDTIARNHLSVLMKWKTDCHNYNGAKWYRALDQQIRAGAWDSGIRTLAIVAIEDLLKELTEEIGTSPWLKPNIFGDTYSDEHVNSWVGSSPSELTEEPPSDQESRSEYE